MTDLELMVRAKEYISKLANGIDPTTGEVCEEDSVLNNVKTVRCLHYVEKVLDKVIENNGEVGRGKRKAKVPFSITPEEVQAIKIMNNPVHITKFVDRINETIEIDGMKKLSYKTITNWLETKGFLEAIESESGTLNKVPTEAGINLGITRIEKNGYRGSYHAYIYDVHAQQFILDNLVDM